MYVTSCVKRGESRKTGVCVGRCVKRDNTEEGRAGMDSDVQRKEKGKKNMSGVDTGIGRCAEKI